MTAREKSTRVCTCDWLKNAATDARFPVEYDEQSNKFKLQCRLEDGKLGYTVLHFCPFCGGMAPDIRKEKTFTQISEQEFLRLQELTRQIKSIEDALRILGEPQLVYSPLSMQAQISQAEQEMLQNARSLTYQNISETAIIHITEYEQGGVRIVFQEKYIG